MYLVCVCQTDTDKKSQKMLLSTFADMHDNRIKHVWASGLDVQYTTVRWLVEAAAGTGGAGASQLPCASQHG